MLAEEDPLREDLLLAAVRQASREEHRVLVVLSLLVLLLQDLS